VVVVSLGAAGAFFASKDGIQRFRAPTVRIRSKVGAGDSMVAGIVYGMASDKSIRDAVMLGIAAGAAAVMTPGTELCRGEDVMRLFNQMIAKNK
jgi:6-phosphofructokinase 2